MALRVLRSDNQQQPDEAEIVKDWQKWAKNIGYIFKKKIPVVQGTMKITLEAWEHPHMLEHAYLLYHPEIPTSKDTEALYILESEDEQEAMIESCTQLSSVAMQMLQTRNNIQQTYKASQN